MIYANKTLSTFPNGQKLEVPEKFPYLGNHFVILIVAWRKRKAHKGGPRKAMPMVRNMGHVKWRVRAVSYVLM